MNIFEGLEKFGLNISDQTDLFGEEKKEKKENETAVQKEIIPTEEDYLMDKTARCTVCDKTFPTKAVRTTKLRRLDPDKDLRPRFQYIDTIKYDITSCPYCGYTGMNRYYEHLSSMQIRLIRESVGANFKPTTVGVPSVYDYGYAIERYKLSLFCTIVKKGSVSERAYTCLKLAWLCRGKAEEMLEKGMTEESETLKNCRKEEMTYYAQAYEGMSKAVSSESFPICGMDQYTMDLLLAAMAFKLEKYDEASRFISRLLVSRSASANVRKRAFDLKEEILEKLKSKEQ